jgi:hypothetical protein
VTTYFVVKEKEGQSNIIISMTYSLVYLTKHKIAKLTTVKQTNTSQGTDESYKNWVLDTKCR